MENAGDVTGSTSCVMLNQMDRGDFYRPTAYKYRDYVIRSLIKTIYQQFVMEQLAGDEIAPEDPKHWRQQATRLPLWMESARCWDPLGNNSAGLTDVWRCFSGFRSAMRQVSRSQIRPICKVIAQKAFFIYGMISLQTPKNKISKSSGKKKIEKLLTP